MENVFNKLINNYGKNRVQQLFYRAKNVSDTEVNIVSHNADLLVFQELREVLMNMGIFIVATSETEINTRKKLKKTIDIVPFIEFLFNKLGA